MSSENKVFIASLDVGTTTVKCQLIDSEGIACYSASDRVELLYPQSGYIEIDPNCLWNTIVNVVKRAVTGEAKVGFDRINCLAISSQRCSFVTWNRETGLPYHRIITWKDLRANSMVKQMNKSYVVRAVRFLFRCLYLISGSRKFMLGSMMKFLNAQVTVRLMWVLRENLRVQSDLSKGLVALGTIDSWLLNKLSGGALHVTDFSHASVTGMFDPFSLQWMDPVLRYYGIPQSILPKVVESAGTHFGDVSADVFGVEIPIRASIADQSAALFGSCCFKSDELKVTLGTGAFVSVNTATVPLGSASGLYPTVGWKYGGGVLLYTTEGSSNDTASVIQWAKEIGLCNDISKSALIASSVPDNGGVYFVPAFSGIQVPLDDADAGTGFIGVTPTTTKNHMLRAVLESIAFRICQIYELFNREISEEIKIIKVDGGVSKNDFVLQTLANVTQKPIERPVNQEMSALGAAYLAGLTEGVWKDVNTLKDLRKLDRTFYPSPDSEATTRSYKQWLTAVKRFTKWYQSSSTISRPI